MEAACCPTSRHLNHIFASRQLFVGTAGPVKGGRVKGRRQEGAGEEFGHYEIGD